MAVKESSPLDRPGYLEKLEDAVTYALNWHRMDPNRSTLDMATAAVMAAGPNAPWGRNRWPEFLAAVREAAK